MTPLCLSLIASITPLAGMEGWTAPDRDVPDCTWQPLPLFASAYVQSPGPSAPSEPLYLRKQPIYAAILPRTAPFDWGNYECSLWPGMRLRIANWGRKTERFAKVYYEGRVYWASKFYRSGVRSLVPVGAATSAIPPRRQRIAR